MEQSINRIEQALLSWEPKEEKFRKLFPESERTVLQERIKQYKHIALKYRAAESQEERSSLRILKADIARLERKVNSRKLIGLLYKIVAAPVVKMFTVRKYNRGAANDEITVQRAISKAGITHFNNAQIKAIASGAKDVLNLAYNFSATERVDYHVNFGLSKNGERQMDSIAITCSDHKQKQTRSQTFYTENGYDISAMDAYHLINGRPLCKEYINNTGAKATVWIQLDFNDKDAEGNYKLRAYPETLAYSVCNGLEQLPIKNKEHMDFVAIARQLQDGASVPVTLTINKQDFDVSIEANPAHNNILLREADKKEVALITLIERAQPLQKNRVIELNNSQEVKNVPKARI